MDEVAVIVAVHFTLTNAADGTQVISAGRVNALVLTIANAGTSAMTFKGGKAVPEDSAPSGPSAMYLSFLDLLGLHELTQLRIAAAPGWTATLFTGPAPTWALTPDRDTVLRPGESLAFVLDNVVPTRPKRSAPLIVDFHAMGVPSGSRSLALEIGPARRGPHDVIQRRV